MTQIYTRRGEGYFILYYYRTTKFSVLVYEYSYIVVLDYESRPRLDLDYVD